MRELSDLTEETVQAALGRRHRDDPVVGRSGGPAGNARLTAWTGLVLLVLFLVELVTLLDVRGLISWHVAVGTLLVPPALLKTATTGWRILRYYTGSTPYREAGPPPLMLRLLGPFVVLSTLAVLGTGVALVLVGPDSGRRALVTGLGLRVDAITLHQAAFAGWAVLTGLHTLGRLIPAVRTAVGGVAGSERMPGRTLRVGLLLAMLVAGALLAVLLVGRDSGWSHDRRFDQRYDRGDDRPQLLPSSKVT
jgi:hypothetical protein